MFRITPPLSKVIRNRYLFLYFIFSSFLLISFLTRIFLMIISFDNLDLTPLIFIKILGVGLFYDIVASIYYLMPLVIYLLVTPIKLYNSKINRVILYFISISILFITIFSSVSEYFFWEEFGKRFNFIAVDYLVYTHEVIHNIEESYPLNAILLSILSISIIITYIFKRYINLEDSIGLVKRLKISTIIIFISLISFYGFDKQGLSNISNNIYDNELAKNGIYSIFSAFRHNELDYNEFYKTIPTKEVFKNLKSLEGFNNKNPKIVKFNQKESKKNIILIMVESLSAKYMGVYGNKKQLTPYLDKLISQSLFFDNLFATGTRTVRGMEAVNLSIPPTAGRSIIKRPKNDNMDSFGKILKSKGYNNKFIYGGYGYFDNMNNFFSKNGYKIVDRLKFKKNEITFANAWGACDGDLFNKTLSEADKSFQNKKPFFYFLMTTSNHRPYTYPNNLIDIPSHTGRDGAVKYTDYAIAKFIERAKTKKWFRDTIFVIIADHNGGSAGKSSLPLYRYKIPFIIYNSYIIKPRVISKLSSQIDTMPTILSLLNISYSGRFYGNNILDKNFKERAFIGNYQKLGYVEGDYLYYLTPDKKSHKNRVEKLSLNSVVYKEQKISKDEEEKLITYYQGASYIYKNSK